MITAPARAPTTTRRGLPSASPVRTLPPMRTTTRLTLSLTTRAAGILALALLLVPHPAYATDWARFLADVGCTANPSRCRPSSSPTDRRLDALEDQADDLQRQLNTETDDRLRERYEAQRDADIHPAPRPADPLAW